jgi:hypothetical protein
MMSQPGSPRPSATDGARAAAEQVARALVAELEGDPSLDRPAQLRRRVDAADRLEAYGLDAAQSVNGATSPADAALYDRACAIHARLQAADSQLFESIRHDIGQGRGALRLAEWLEPDSHAESTAGPQRGDTYDYLDVLVAGILQFDTPAETPSLAPEMVAYQPTPARHIFDLLRRAGLTRNDVLVDLGSGLGHVPLLAAICTSARSVGVELQPAYVGVARRSAHALGLTGATFVQQDARSVDLSAGTFFYLYTPFTGAILSSVLDSLRREAAGRAIRVCTLGPCTEVVGQESWLRPDVALGPDRVVIFSSCDERGAHTHRIAQSIRPEGEQR